MVIDRSPLHWRCLLDCRVDVVVVVPVLDRAAVVGCAGAASMRQRHVCVG